MPRTFPTHTLSMRLEDWPQFDQAAWAKALEPAGPFDEERRALTWEDSTRRLYVNAYGRWLTWLQTHGRLDRTARPEDRATRDQVKAFYQSLLDDGLGGFTIAQRLMGLSAILRVMAPTIDFTWIKDASIRVHKRAEPVKDIEKRLQPAEEVLKLGYDLMEEAETGDFRSELDRALMYRDGLAIVLLVHRPLRIGNFASIIIGEHLERCGDEWRLTYDADEVKNDRRFACALPVEVVAHLDRYIQVWRKVLLARRKQGGAEGRLWLANTGAPLKANDMNPMICRRTRARFGRPINPHAFRSLAATTIAIHNPEGATGIAAVLGHTRLETSEVHYNKARQGSAARELQTIVQERRNVTRRKRTPEQVDFGPLFARPDDAHQKDRSQPSREGGS